ncbi:MAG: type III secretion system chaperone [Rhodobacteraceae bacterium]|nr:type III secretion system chaperone [Paracoccaceae bacterium]
MDQSHLARLFEELGPLLERMVIVEYPDAGAFQLQDEDGLIVMINRDEERQCLVFFSDIGQPPASAAAKLYPMLLIMNSQWESTGGLHFALEEENGSCGLYWELPLSVLTPQALANGVSSFSERATSWRQIVEGSDRLGDDPDQSDITRHHSNAISV